MIQIALSPCPNDTYLFYGWISGKVGEELPCKAHFFDIQELNARALKQEYPVIKVSSPVYERMKEKYALLPIGQAIGYGVGPKLIASQKLQPNQQTRVAIPGEWTCAHMLFKHFYPECTRTHFCRYDEIFTLLHQGRVDAGVVIHESRFTFEREGFYEIADLGTLYEEREKKPLLLGGIMVEKGPHVSQVTHILERSYLYAKAHHDEAMEFVLHYAQEKERKVVEQHITLYLHEAASFCH